MKINKIQIKNIIKEELQNLLDEFKAPERMQGIPNPEDMGFKLPEVDAQMISKLKKDIVESGLLDFVKNNFPFKSLQTIGGLKESKKEADNLDLILQNVELMKNGRTWQNNFHTNLQVLKAKLDDLPTEFSRYKTHTEYYEQGEFLQNWVGVFEMELAKTWAERNLPTFKKFAKDNKEKLSAIFQKFSTFSRELVSLGVAIAPFAFLVIAAVGMMLDGHIRSGPEYAKTMMGLGIYGTQISFFILFLRCFLFGGCSENN